MLAAAFYAINVPLSKLLLQHVGETTMAALLYLGAGIGIGILSLFNRKDRQQSEKLSKSDLPFVILHERLSWLYFAALIVMIGGAALVVIDTLKRNHAHLHTHTFTHTHDGSTHTYTITHTHDHNHYLSDENHTHHHPVKELERKEEHYGV